MPLPNRPVDPSKISFDPSCFKITGSRSEWIAARLAPLYPLRFDSLGAAKAAGFPDAVQFDTPTTIRIHWEKPA